MDGVRRQIIRPTEGKRVQLYDVRFRFLVESADVGGALAVVETEVPSGVLVKPHRHSQEDEITYVLDGVIGARVGDEEMDLKAGSVLVKPRGEPHALWNRGPATARVLEILTPGGFEGYFAEMEPVLRGSGHDREPAFYSLATKYGIEIMDDWVDDLETRFGVKL